MREAKIILPKKDNDGNSLFFEHDCFRLELLDAFGGFSEFEIRGQWRNGTGKVYRDESIEYRIAGKWDTAQAAKLESLASQYARRCIQECIYVVHGDGSVVFVDAPIAEVISAQA